MENKLCRLCAKKSDSLLPIFDKPDVQKTSQLLFIFTGIRVSIDDSLPLNICQQCKTFVEKSRIFRYKCLKAQEVLKKKKQEEDNKKLKNKIKAKKKLDNGKTNKKINHDDSEGIDTDDNDGQNVNDNEQNDFDSFNNDDNRTNDVNEFLDIDMNLKPEHTVCQHCGVQMHFNMLQRHLRAKHGYEKIHKCSYCDYRGADKHTTQVHERIHTGERPHVCSTCGAAYMRRSTLLQHVGTHLTERNFMCDECPAKLKSKRLLQTHKNRHKQDKYKFKCYMCESTFNKRLYATNHLKKFHKIEMPDLSKIIKFDKNSGDILSNNHLSKWHSARRFELQNSQED